MNKPIQLYARVVGFGGAGQQKSLDLYDLRGSKTMSGMIGEGVRMETELQEAIQSGLAEAVATMSKHVIIHSTQLTPSESLPKGFAYSCMGFLICNNMREVKIDQEILKKDAEYLQKHIE